MSKFVKDLITNDLKSRWQDVGDAVLVDVAALGGNQSVEVRKILREKNIRMTVVKNSLARRACEGTPLYPAFEQLGGTTAVVWGAEDIVSLAKEVTKVAETKGYEGFVAKGGVMGGSPLTSEEVKGVSKWPSRTEQLSILMGQILSPGSTLSSQLLGPARGLASQIKQHSERDSE